MGTGFYTNAAAAFAGNLVGPTNIFLLNDSNNNNAFDLGRPVESERPFDTAAHGPQIGTSET